MSAKAPKVAPIAGPRDDLLVVGMAAAELELVGDGVDEEETTESG